MNPKKSSEVKISFHLVILALKTRFEPVEFKAFGKKLYKP